MACRRPTLDAFVSVYRWVRSHSEVRTSYKGIVRISYCVASATLVCGANGHDQLPIWHHGQETRRSTDARGRFQRREGVLH